MVADVEAALASVGWPLEFRRDAGRVHRAAGCLDAPAGSAGAAALVILLLLQASYRSWRLATLTFLTLPVALVGGVLSAYLFGGGVISLGSLVGFLAVFGIVARNGIMLISHAQHLEKVEGEPFGPQLVLRAAEERLVPIMMTVLTTGLALIPLVAAGSIPGQEIEHPMALVILGGLITATLLNLFVVPSLCSFGSPSPAASADRSCRRRAGSPEREGAGTGGAPRTHRPSPERNGGPSQRFR